LHRQPAIRGSLENAGGGIDTEWKLTEAQQRFFDEKKERVSNLPEEATEREKELAKAAKFFIGYAENLQKKLNRMKQKLESSVNEKDGTRDKSKDDKFKMWNCLVSCYCAINRHFGDKIRENVENNLRTQKEGQLRKAMAEVERLSKL
jgi:hypothetical protein